MTSNHKSKKVDINRKIIHVDMDSFYASVEIAENPQLAKLPVAVAGSSDLRGVVTTCNYIAREYGVKSAMPSVVAKKLCPEIIFLPVNMSKYRKVSKEIHKIFRCYTKIVEPISLDEAFLDVSKSQYCDGDPNIMARQIRKKIFEDLRITASAGIASNKFLAKLASEWNKPDGQYLITNNHIEDFVKNLSVRKIPGVGSKTEKIMSDFGIRTCQDLQNYDLEILVKMFGKFGLDLFDLCRGIDDRNVISERSIKSLSIEDTYVNDLRSFEECEIELRNIFYKLEERLKDKKKSSKKIKSCFIKVKYSDFKSSTHQIQSASIDLKIYRNLLIRAYARKSLPIRLLGLGVYFDNRPQLSLNIC